MIAKVQAQDIRKGDTLVLPSGQRVTCDGATTWPDGTISVHWWRFAMRGEPGFKNPERIGDHNDGRYLGSLIAVPADYSWRVDA